MVRRRSGLNWGVKDEDAEEGSVKVVVVTRIWVSEWEYDEAGGV